MPSPSQIVGQFMAAFIEAWPSKDATELVKFFSSHAVYHNMPLEPVSGRKAIRHALESFMGLGGQVSVDVFNIVADGERVVVERVDHFTDSGKSSSLPMMGIFEFKDGLITAWRDYSISANSNARRPKGSAVFDQAQRPAQTRGAGFDNLGMFSPGRFSGSLGLVMR